MSGDLQPNPLSAPATAVGGNLDAVGKFTPNRNFQLVLRDNHRSAADIFLHLDLRSLANAKPQSLDGYVVTLSTGYNQPLAFSSITKGHLILLLG
jgi:hypothetical protein